jgi:solute carrier family 15 oligopeptide transporter 1
MKTFFSWFYAAINSGAMISSILTPYLRNSPCLGQETCFPLAFGVPSALMVVALGKLVWKTLGMIVK